MTAEEYFKVWNSAYYYESNNHNDLIKIMNDYAKLKCGELLEIVAEKAKIKEVDYEDELEWIYYTIVDKDSILNAVDLETFIV